MLSFFGKVFLLLGAAFGLGAFAGRRGRSDGAEPTTPSTSPEPRNPPRGRPSSQEAVTTQVAEPMPASAPTAEPAAPQPERTPASEAPAGKPESSAAPANGAPAKKSYAAPREDPLAAKHRAAAFDRDFRTLDYRALSKDEAAREKERRSRQHSSWQASDPASHAPSPPLQNAQFSHFGGSFVSAEIVRGRSTELVPDLMPTLPGDGIAPSPEPAVTPSPRRTLAGPDPSGPTPKREQRKYLPEDPLVAKHRAAPFDKDFRTLDYRHLGSSPRSGTSSREAIEPADTENRRAGEAAEGQQACRTAGAAGPVPGTGVEEPAGGEGPAAGGRESRNGGHAVLAEETMIREPDRLDAPRAGTPDDLTRIDGIGPSLERLLFESGIYHFDQIARWSAGEIHWFEARSGFPGRVARERWVEQAQALVDDRATPRTAV